MPRILIIILASLLTLLPGCMVRDLKQDLQTVQHQYGYLKARVVSSPGDANVLVGIFRHSDNGLVQTGASSVVAGEEFLMLASVGQNTLFAFADLNDDSKYQTGEPGVRIDTPLINWLQDVDTTVQPDFSALREQVIELNATSNFDIELDFTIASQRQHGGSTANFLKVVSWDDPRFSAENIRLGMWEPGHFFEQIGFGLYSLQEFKPHQKTILLVHGLNDSPPVFQHLVEPFLADYQILLFHFPSGLSLDFTSYALTKAVEEVLHQFDIQQLDVIAHSMGGLVSQGMLNALNPRLRPRIRNYVTMSTPFAGHAGAELGIKWAPTIAPVWWSMVPNSRYIQSLEKSDFSAGPNHHLLFSFAHEAGGDSQPDDGVVTVKSELAYPAQRNTTGVYGIADNHAGIVNNACTAQLLRLILEDGSSRVTFPTC
ncbi:MAG: hypothetical protein O3A63_15940 [Proteobacteria bacterium]|nr:hypothetical protein [Pseudomonadota bacterium]